MPPAEDTPEEAKFPDLLADSAMLKNAGVGLGDEASYLLMLSLKALAVGCPPEGRQFFLSQMGRALEDSERMLKVKRG